MKNNTEIYKSARNNAILSIEKPIVKGGGCKTIALDTV